MKIVIVGAGKVGYSLAQRLIQDNHDVYVIDYRYYSGGLVNLIKENDIKDVIFLNTTIAITTSSVNTMYSIF